MVSKSSYDELNQKFEHKLFFSKFLVILFYRKEPLGLNSKGYCLLFIFQCTLFLPSADKTHSNTPKFKSQHIFQIFLKYF
jgi:hypothetical protein